MAICPFCKHPEARELRPVVHPDERYLVCGACGCGWLDQPPAAPEQLYTEGYFVEGGDKAGYVDYDADRRWHRANARDRLRRLRRAMGTVRVPGELVEVGTATGHFLDVAAAGGWETHGVEASRWAAERARGKGHEVVERLAELDDPVDAVCFFQVLEHMPDPENSLAQAARLVRPGGVVLCETWDVESRVARGAGPRWQQLSPPSVLWLFSKQGLSTMAERAGLELVEWRTTPKWVSVATVLGQSVPALGKGLPGRILGRAGRLVALPYPLDDLVTVTFVRRS